MAESQGAEPRWVLLGTDTGKGIYRARWDAKTGEIGTVELAIATDRPNYFARHPKLPVIYSVNEMSGAKAGVSAFRVDAATAELTLIDEVRSGGEGPCYVSVDHAGIEAFVANYAGGSVSYFAVSYEYGGLSDAIATHAYELQKPGANAERQDKSHMHCVTVAPDNKFLLACDLGADLIRLYRIGMSGHAGPPFTLPPVGTRMTPVGEVAARAGSGPRHVAFHPSGKWVYCVHELDCSIDIYDWKVTGEKPEMVLREGSVVSVLAKGVAIGGNTGCEVVVSDDGRYLYTCVRGIGELVVYAIDAVAGMLTERQRVKCGGTVPRYIALDPSRRWLLCCNQEAPGSVTVFARDSRTGRLGETGKKFAAETPMFVEWV